MVLGWTPPAPHLSKVVVETVWSWCGAADSWRKRTLLRLWLKVYEANSQWVIATASVLGSPRSIELRLMTSDPGCATRFSVDPLDPLHGPTESGGFHQRGRVARSIGPHGLFHGFGRTNRSLQKRVGTSESAWVSICRIVGMKNLRANGEQMLGNMIGVEVVWDSSSKLRMMAQVTCFQKSSVTHSSE